MIIVTQSTFGYLALATADCSQLPAVANAYPIHEVELNSCKFYRSGETFQYICTSVSCQVMSYAGQNNLETVQDKR